MMSTVAIRNTKQVVPQLREPLFGDPDWVCPYSHTPNAETLAAIQETEDIIAGKIPAKSYKTVEELFAALESDDEDEN
ncbi:hypothetical protein FACS189419_10190 [Planctomycetales bacterium]|nr:hypothetical protein FACS189419_10190 [Planctomycetales bacterium]